MRGIVFLTILTLWCSCKQSVLDRKYNSNQFSKDTIALKKELDTDAFLQLKTYIREENIKLTSNFKYKHLVIMSASYNRDKLLKEFSKTIATRKKMICSKKWKVTKTETATSVKAKISEHKKEPKNNTDFEKEHSLVTFKEDNTFEQTNKNNSEAIKGKWKFSSNNFSFNNKRFSIVSIDEEQILLKRVERVSDDSGQKIIKQTLEFSAL